MTGFSLILLRAHNECLRKSCSESRSTLNNVSFSKYRRKDSLTSHFLEFIIELDLVTDSPGNRTVFLIECGLGIATFSICHKGQFACCRPLRDFQFIFHTRYWHHQNRSQSNNHNILFHNSVLFTS